MPFKKGTSGNPGGLTSKDVKLRQTIRELAGKYAPRAIERLKELMEDPDCGAQACKEILDRSVGKPAQAVELSGEGGGPLEVAITVKLKNA